MNAESNYDATLGEQNDQGKSFLESNRPKAWNIVAEGSALGEKPK
jgi:hypothetical protein